MKAQDVDELFPELLDKYYSFCVERHPYEKVVSDYCMLRYSPHHKLKDDLTWDEYFAHRQFPLNYPLYTDPIAERVMVRSVLRYESLNAEFQTVCDRLGIPFSGRLDIWAKGEYRTNYPASRMEKRYRDRLNEIFKREFALWGYTQW